MDMGGGEGLADGEQCKQGPGKCMVSVGGHGWELEKEKRRNIVTCDEVGGGA